MFHVSVPIVEKEIQTSIFDEMSPNRVVPFVPIPLLTPQPRLVSCTDIYPPYDEFNGNVNSLPENAGILSAKDIEITHADGVRFLETIKGKKWTCVEVIEAFCTRALLAQKYVHLKPSLL